MSSFLPTKFYEYPDFPCLCTYLYTIPEYVSPLNQFIRPIRIVMYNGKDDLIENECKMTLLNIFLSNFAVLSIGIQEMTTCKYFDSACEIHVKHSVNEEYKATCSSEFAIWARS